MNDFSSLFSNSVVSSVVGSTVRDSFTSESPFYPNPTGPLVFPTGSSGGDCGNPGGLLGAIIDFFVSY